MFFINVTVWRECDGYSTLVGHFYSHKAARHHLEHVLDVEIHSKLGTVLPVRSPPVQGQTDRLPVQAQTRQIRRCAVLRL